MRKNGNDRDAKRVTWWLAALIGLLVAGALVFNLFWYKKPSADIDNKPAINSPAPAPEKPPGS